MPACAAAQEKILALLSSGEGAMEPKQFGTAKELFYALAEALKTAQTILLFGGAGSVSPHEGAIAAGDGAVYSAESGADGSVAKKALYSSRKKIFRAMPPSRWAQLRSRRRMGLFAGLC